METEVQRFIITVRSVRETALSASDIHDALLEAANGNMFPEPGEVDVESITMVDRHSTGRMKTNRMTYTIEDVA